MSSPCIAEIHLELLALPLRVPYKLAFGPVTQFDTLIVTVIDEDGREGFGEATILTGYTPETIDSCWREAGSLADAMVGLEFADAKDAALVRHGQAPFTVTALVSAIEMLEGHPLLHIKAPVLVPLLAILNATDEAAIEQEITAHVAAGYGTIKVKVGFELESDLKRTAFIQSCLPGGVRIRIDGNQGFSKEDGVAFASQISPDQVELLEQPCHMDDWDASAAVGAVSNVPLMLDESIYGPREIEMAAKLGTVKFVKLKLMKAGSLDALAKQLDLIGDLGMTPVLGNGVAADPGCWMEACVARRHIDNAGEMNGFLKPHARLFKTPMTVERGAIKLLPGRPAMVDVGPFVQARHSKRHA
ncbi:MAG: mandelate racemase [Proteobacteria bacterium]|nr:mandelate racemase [Pseudomonadota bacterium]